MPQEWALSCAGLVRTVSRLECRIFHIICPITGHRSGEVLPPDTQTSPTERHTTHRDYDRSKA